jgi:Ca-activated chloride channel family protein
MRKPILIVGLFLAIATIALVYATQSNSLTTTTRTIRKFTPPTKGTGNVLVEWKLSNPYMLRKAGLGDAYLDLRVTGKALPGAKRKSLNLVLVIDRSGSMADENKLEKVKQAAVSIVNQMSGADRLCIVIYDDAVNTILPSSPVENSERIRELLYSLTPGGSTNLAGGLQQGFEEARQHFREDYLNRVILLSDGLANVGVIDPVEITAIANRIRERSISVSTMGVGIDFNETLMANVADHSGGNYYYISNEVNMADIFRREWNLMQNVVANNAVATLELAPGVEVEDVAGFQWKVANGKLRVHVPDIYSGESKRILIHLKAPANRKHLVSLGTAEFTYTDITAEKPKTFAQSYTPAIQVIEDPALVASNFDDEVQSKVAAVHASRKMEEAYRRLESGDQDGAKRIAEQTLYELKALGYVANEKQALRYDTFVNDLKAPEMEPARQKDILKKQKAADRNAQQSSPQ